MNAIKSFIIIRSNAQIKKGIHGLFLLACFMLTHFSANAQQLKPKWVDDLGGVNASCTVTNLVVDKQNNIYIAGYFSGSVDFDPSAGVNMLTCPGILNVFVGKYTPDGALIWVESFTDNGDDLSAGLAVDKDGIISITGNFSSQNFDADPGPGVYSLGDNEYVMGGAPVSFFIHLDNNGNFLWAYGLYGGSISNNVTTDSQNNVIVTYSSPYPVTIGDSTYVPLSGGYIGLISKYSPTGKELWTLVLGNTQANQFIYVSGCGVDSMDNIIVSGFFNFTVNFNPSGTPNNLTANSNTNNSYFLAKYSPSGILAWANKIENPSFTIIGNAVGIDPQNNVYFGTTYQQSITFNSSVTLTSTGEQDICFAKYSPAGILQFAKSTQGNASFGADGLLNIAIDKNSNLYLTGYFLGTVNFNPNAGNPENITLSNNESRGFFVAEYDLNGNYIYALGRGNANCDQTGGFGIAIDNSNNVDVAGEFCSTVNVDPSGCSSATVTAKSGNGNSDGFITQYASAALANDIITPPPITSFCTSGTPAAITGSTPTGGSGTYTYQWQSSADSVTFTNITGATGQNYTPATLTATTYYQRVVSSVCATPVASNIVSFTIAPTPIAPTLAAATTCNGSTATLAVTAPQPGITYNWYASATGDTVLFTGTTFTTPALTAAATYYAAAVNSTGCSSATRAPATVSILPALAAPVVTVGPSTSSTVIFTWAAVPGATGYQVSTDGGQTYTAPGGGPTALTDTASGLQGGQSVTLIVEATGSIACQVSTASAAATGQAISPTDDIIYVPNAFTPNGDGRNDQAHVHGENIQSLKFYIYDQWGELLFTSLNQQNGWDGTYKGTKEPAGVYVYYLEAIMNDGQNIKKKGTITLLK